MTPSPSGSTLAFAIALHLAAPAPFGDRPSSGSTDTFGRSPFISLHPYLSAIALISQHRHLWAIAPLIPFGTLHTDPSLSLLNLCG
ncbi:hypothetical protein HNI00_15040 [Thermoleptolyngbya oregonensis NK1-22]|uniref:Uncharacterized protein n=1 Tax=Thermoleptolyngbya oregonensis NK1-22 TaxID=2547457 RepID=A0AA96Y655_9CYAN|nr:hypothetical protein [Thermoleptolyngbya oregonensis]WOB44309.1 hypothetical protein HNI00_15040 [Thermoleptolyngbya oregonensis NK1-22]